MGTIADKLNKALTNKADIKNALIEQGRDPNDNMSTWGDEIRAIETGGGGEDTGTGEFEARYCFFDKYGRYQIISKYADIMGTFDKPTTPVGDIAEVPGYCPALTFQGWNFDDNELTNVTGDLDIGAIYIPTDGKTHIYIDIENDTILDYTFNLTINNIGTGTFYFDFGDGATAYSATTNGLHTIAHSYLAKGSYHITTWLEGADSNGEIILGTNTTYAKAFVGDYNSSVHNNTIKRIYFGSDCKNLYPASIPQLRACEVLSLHNAMTRIYIQWYHKLHYLILPKTATAGTLTPQRASFEFLSMPLNITGLSSGSSPFSTTRVEKLISAGTGITGIASTYYTQYSMRSINLTGATSFDMRDTNAETVSLPSSLTALSNTSSVNNSVPIKIIVMRATTPSTLRGNLGYYCKIYVPQASLSVYQNATNWSVYASQMIGY